MKQSIFFALGLLSFSSASFAQTGFSFGLRVGDTMESRLPGGPGAVDSKRAFGGYGNYFWDDHFGVEFGYSDLGTSNRSGAADAGFRLSGALYTLGLLGRASLQDQFSIFGGLGAFNLREDGTSITLIGPRNLDNNDSGFYAEFGGQYAFNDKIGARLSYQWFNFENGSDGTPWLGLEVRF
jgi:opacity protein-like surface antigen